ncbi:response regulator [Angustibacter sp. McL0619]|uniref:response regulator n=1 Tax=Angustibacter sp. McL0619 TaxID=3415676 RepID=UPI003CE8CEC6
MTIRVVLADDHPMFRFGLRAVLEQTEGIEVVGEAADGAALLALVDELDPDVVLTDLSMSDVDGVTVIQTLARTHQVLPVLAMTMHADEVHVRAALRAGACGYLLKGADALAIAGAVEAAASGQVVLDPAISQQVIAAYAGSDERDPVAFPELTARETEVLRLIAVGCRNHEIARRLGIAEKTVRNLTSSVLVKLRVPDRTAAALRAQEVGLGSPMP